MEKNMGTIDRSIRIVVALALILAGFYWLGTPWNIIAYIVAAIFIVTSAIGVCPLYISFGLRTRK